MHVITRSCVLFFWMHTLTFVKSQEPLPDCTLQDFLNGPLFDSNFDTTGLEASYVAGRQIRVSCSTGYSGFFLLFCIEGKWQSRGTKCQQPLPDCTLQDFLNGPLFDSNFNTTGLEASYVAGKQIRVSCSTGYSGFFQLLCVEGKWQSRGTKCQPQQCPVIHVSNNVQVIGDPEEANVGNVVRFSCKSNSEILIGSQEIYCNENGEWSGEAPTCNGKGCPVPVIENGRVPGDIQEYKEDDILPFQCNPGFQPTEDRPSKCTKPGLRAEWSPTPACEPNAAITCKLQLPSLHGTEYHPSYKNVFSPGDTVTVTCGQRHWISDPLRTSEVVSCQNDGQWSLSPICQEVTCSNRRDPLVDRWYDNYWRQQNKLGDEVGYRCTTGYKSTGGATRATCTREGWKPDPLCQAPLDCEQPPPLENGDTKNSMKSSYRHNERVEYICQNYYTMQGGPFKTCNNGEWTGEIICLRPCTVDEEAMRGRNIRFRYGRKDKLYLAHGDVIEFSCTTGRPVGSLGMRPMCVDGVVHLPSCQ